MLEHIVKNGESIEEIVQIYHIELEELKMVNLHITDFKHLVSGMKIKIPLLNQEIEQILENTESFVQKYYPKVHEISDEKTKEEQIDFYRKEEVEEKNISSKGVPYPGILPPRRPFNLR